AGAEPPPNPLRVWGGLIVLALASIATLVHRLLRSRTFQRRGLGAGIASILVGLACLAPHSAVAAEPAPKMRGAGPESRFHVNDEPPEQSVPSVDERNAHPMDFAYFLMELIEHADKATASGQTERAVHYYRALIAAEPDRSIGYSKLCSALEGNA